MPGLTVLPLNLGTFWLDHGDPQRALGLLRATAEAARERGVDQISGWTQMVLAEAALALSDARGGAQRARRGARALRAQPATAARQQRAERLMSRA